MKMSIIGHLPAMQTAQSTVNAGASDMRCFPNQSAFFLVQRQNRQGRQKMKEEGSGWSVVVFLPFPAAGCNTPTLA